MSVSVGYLLGLLPELRPFISRYSNGYKVFISKKALPAPRNIKQVRENLSKFVA